MTVRSTPRAHGRPQGGSEEIVRAILDATLEQLEARGFVDLRVEEVARVAGVNKTSVYRRWPSKGELVLAALATTSDEGPPFVESGDLRRDLVDLLTAKTATLSTPRARRILRALMVFDADAEGVAALTDALRQHRYSTPRGVLARAVERGALPQGSDTGFLCELLLAPILHRILIVNEPVDAAFLARLVDQVLAGAAHVPPAAPPEPPGRPAPRPRAPSKRL
jgi:AcrR family transcriptional regulator